MSMRLECKLAMLQLLIPHENELASRIDHWFAIYLLDCLKGFWDDSARHDQAFRFFGSSSR
jgi:hypothetical protein